MGWALGDPAAARIVLIEIHAASKDARREHYRTLGLLLRRTEEILSSRPLSDDGPRIPALALVGGDRRVDRNGAPLRGIAPAGRTGHRTGRLASLLCDRGPGRAPRTSPAGAGSRRPACARPPPAPALREPALLPRGPGGAASRAVRRRPAARGSSRPPPTSSPPRAMPPPPSPTSPPGARVGRAAFYSQFESKEAALPRRPGRISSSAASGCSRASTSAPRCGPRRVLARALAALLRHFAERPRPGLARDRRRQGRGPRHHRRRQRQPPRLRAAARGRLSPLRGPRAAGDLPRRGGQGRSTRCSGTTRCGGRGEQMQELLPEAAYIALAPFIGAPGAAAFIERAPPSGALQLPAASAGRAPAARPGRA